MADKHEEAARRKALAAKYTDRVHEHQRKLRERLGDAQYDFFKNHERSADQTVYAELAAAMRDPHTVPSEYIARKLGWLFPLAIPSREKDVILYFADKLWEYPYSDSYCRRSFRAKGNGAYASKLLRIIRGYGSPHMPLIDEPIEKILNGELPEEAQAFLDEYSWRGCGYTGWQVAYALDQKNRIGNFRSHR